MGWLVLRVKLEYGALEILYRIRLAIYIRHFPEFAADREALLSQVAMRLPICQELAAYTLACLFERHAVCLTPNSARCCCQDQPGKNKAGKAVEKSFFHSGYPPIV